MAEHSYRTVALLIKPVWRGGYETVYYWQVWVEGNHWQSSSYAYPNPKLARYHGVLAMLKMDGYFAFWRLSE